MDPNATNPYTTEIPVSEAEKELHHTAPGSPTPPAPATSDVDTVSSTPTAFDTAPPPLPSRAESSSNKLPMIVVGVLLLVIGSLAGYIFRGKMTSAPSPIASKVTPTEAPAPSPTPTSAIPTPNPLSNRFSSRELGIVFDTAKNLPDSGNAPVLTQLNGSRVYVYASGTQASTGQYVDSLSKVSTDSTIVSAQKITASDPRFTTCTFEVSPQEIYPPTYERVIPTCPNEIGGGMEYFLTDSLHPTRLLYISIGQYSLDSASDSRTPWQDTLRFL